MLALLKMTNHNCHCLLFSSVCAVKDQLPNRFEMEPLTRTQVLLVMGFTALLLLAISRLWMHFGAVPLLAWRWNLITIGLGVGLGAAIAAVSALVYRLWPAYRRSADFYLELIIQPLVLLDLIWLGLLPGISEELLFRGIMLPALGLNTLGLLVSSLCFGISHLSGWQQWAYAIWATVVGVILGWSAIATGNLLVPIIAHVVTNLISGISWKLSHLSQSS
jgi:hypothetical protein